MRICFVRQCSFALLHTLRCCVFVTVVVDAENGHRHHHPMKKRNKKIEQHRTSALIRHWCLWLLLLLRLNDHFLFSSYLPNSVWLDTVRLLRCYCFYLFFWFLFVCPFLSLFIILSTLIAHSLIHLNHSLPLTDFNENNLFWIYILKREGKKTQPKRGHK